MGYQEVQDLQNQLASRFSLASQPMQPDLVTRSWTAGAQLKQQPQKSVLGLLDRAKYGFADDIGQQQIIRQATQKEPVKLKNGQWGIEDVGPNGQKIIRPVDPKGFQMSDVFGDIAESLGKTITAGGGAVGGGLGLLAGGAGSIAGAGAGAGAGELVRQQLGNLLGVRGTEITEGPNKGKFAKTGFGQLGDQNDFGEIAGEAILGAAGQGLALGAGKLLTNLTKAASMPVAQNADDIAKVTLDKVKATNLDQINKFAKVDMNDSITKEFLTNDKVYLTEAVDKIGEKVGSQLDELLVNGKEILNEKLFAPRINQIAQQMGLQSGDDVPINIAKATGTIKTQLSDLIKKNISGAYDDQIKTLGALVEKLDTNPNVTFGELKGFTSEILPDAINVAKNANSRTGMSALVRARQALTTARDEVLPPDLFESYTKGIKAVDNISRIVKKKVIGGEATPGGLSTAFKLGKLTNELSQGKNLTELTDKLVELNKIPGFEGMANEIKDNLYSFLASKAAYAKTPFTGGRLSLSGIGDTIGKTVLSPANRLQMIKGAANLGIIDKTQLGKQVGRVLPKVETLAQLINARKLLDAGTPMKEVIKNVSPQVAKIIKNVSKNKAVQAGVAGAPGQIITRSLNQILYEGNGMNQ